MTTMRIPTVLVLALAAFLHSQVSRAGEAEALPPNKRHQDVVFVDLPVVDSEGIFYGGKCPSMELFGPDERDELSVHKIFFDQSGSIFWDGEKVTNDNLDEKLKSDLVADGLTELHIQPSEDATAGVAINAFRRIIATEFPCYGFVGNENYRKIWKAKKLLTPPWAPSSIRFSTPPDRERIVPPIAVQIISTDGDGRASNDTEFSGVTSAGRCRAFLGEKPVNDGELESLARKAMMEAVKVAGGEEMLMAGTIRAESLPNVIILTTPNTPWRCVGGAIYNLQLSGFLSIGFALMPDSQ